eukprot:31286-Pelagococcus_subviridis.AAC.11
MAASRRGGGRDRACWFVIIHSISSDVLARPASAVRSHPILLLLPLLPLQRPLDVLHDALHALPDGPVRGARDAERDARGHRHVHHRPQQIPDRSQEPEQPAAAAAAAAFVRVVVPLPRLRHRLGTERPFHLLLDELLRDLRAHDIDLLGPKLELVHERRLHRVGYHELDARGVAHDDGWGCSTRRQGSARG